MEEERQPVNIGVKAVRGGMNKDLHPTNIGEEDYIFALNAMESSREGDVGALSTENGNVPLGAIPDGYILIGHVYMELGEIALFLVKKGTDGISEIGIFTENGKYTTYVNDKDSKPKNRLGFRIDKPITAIFRSRRGKERYVYWVDRNNNPPRYFNFDGVAQFQDNDGRWNQARFRLQKTYSIIPLLSNIRVNNSGGRMLAGSYSVGIQLLDANFNKTEWITVTQSVFIYHDDFELPYNQINGSINGNAKPFNFGPSNKSISVNISNIDDAYKFYRLALICSNATNGTINKILVTDKINSEVKEFTFNGNNTVGEITEGEFLQSYTIYSSAQTITQLDNRLLLGNVKEENIQWGNLQKYASKINADCIVKKVVLNNIKDGGNPKNPSVRSGNIGYMPGEIYSFGIVYVFENGIKSPVYHIPGKSKSDDDSVVYSQYRGLVYGMSNDNEVENAYYTTTVSRKKFDFWGLDGNGRSLYGKNVRHHRFPTRNAINVNLVDIEEGKNITVTQYRVKINVRGTLDTTKDSFNFRAVYTVNNQQQSFEQNINPGRYADDDTTTHSYNMDFYGPFNTSDQVGTITLFISGSDGSYDEGHALTFGSSYSDNIHNTFTDNAVFTASLDSISQTYNDRVISTNILGIEFSNIDIPSLDDTNNHKCIGYFIVRNKRTDEEKTILDSGVITPCVRNGNYMAAGLVFPQWSRGEGDSPFTRKYPGRDHNMTEEYCYGIIYPEFLFNGKHFNSIDEIEQTGYYIRQHGWYSYLNVDNVVDGSSMPENLKDRKAFDKGNDDGYTEPEKANSAYNKQWDGMSWTCTIRDSRLKYYNERSGFSIKKKDIKRWYYLASLEKQRMGVGDLVIYNLCCNNRWAIFDSYTKTSIFKKHDDRMPYVILKQANSAPYFNFRNLPYYTDTENIQIFTSDTGNVTSVFGGDVFVTPIRFASMLYIDQHTAKRVKDNVKSWLKIVGAVLLFALSVVFTVATGGAAAPLAAGLTGIGISVLLAASGIKQANMTQAFFTDYDKGLKVCLIDMFFGNMHSYSYGQANYFRYQHTNDVGLEWGEDGPSDDSLMWGADVATDIWFESSVNMSLRNGFFNMNEPTFLAAPGDMQQGNNQALHTWGLKNGNVTASYRDSNYYRGPWNSLELYLQDIILYNDSKRTGGKGYLGIPMGMYYSINPDYYVNNNIKPYFFLPDTYNLLGKDNNSYQHRVVWSQQSFQESFSDNYSQILPNNYKDIDGTTGDIRYLLSFNNELYAFTDECLWHLPNERQERVENDIVTFIGSGELLSIPARKIVDSNTGLSAGCQHIYSIVKTAYGIFYVSSRDNRIYMFSGEGLRALSDDGMRMWFKEHLVVQQDLTYYNKTGKEFQYIDNPTNPIGSGFMVAYDSYNNRVLLSKKDKSVQGPSGSGDFMLVSDGTKTYIFNNYNATIQQYEALGWEYVGIVDSIKMKFKRNVKKKKTIKVKKVKFRDKIVYEERLVDLLSAADFLAFEYNFNSTNGRDLDTKTCISYPVLTPKVGYGAGNTSTYDNDRRFSYSGDNTGYGTEAFVVKLKNIRQDYPTANHVDISCRAFWYGSDAGDHTAYMTVHVFSGGGIVNNNFKFVSTEGGEEIGKFDFPSKEVTTQFYHKQPVDEWKKLTLMGNFRYDLRNNTLLIDDSPISNIVSEYGANFHPIGNANAHKKVLKKFPKTVQEQYTVDEDKQVETLELEFKYITAQPYNSKVVNNSWTLSYSLNSRRWVSYHSYLPNNYISTPTKMLSTIDGNNGIFEHNKKGLYLSYYGRQAKHIVEYVLQVSPLQTSVWESVKLITDAYKLSGGDMYDARLVTFNKAVLYNSRQCSGMLELRVRDIASAGYMDEASQTFPANVSIIDRREKDWNLNDFRDIRSNYDVPIFSEDIGRRQGDYYVDKVLNESGLDINKEWQYMERFRDRYLILRLIFDRYTDTKLVTRYGISHNIN